MENYQLPYFKQINISALDEYYQIETELNGNPISIDLNFDKTTIDKEVAVAIEKFLENIADYDKQNQTFIENDFNSEDGQVKEYVVFHIEELGDESLEQLNIASDSDKEQEFLSKLKLVRIGLYPDGKYGTSYFAVFDYTVSRELTDQLIVVNTDKNGNLDHIAWES